MANADAGQEKLDTLRSYLKRVTAELADAKEELRHRDEAERDPIAVVGVACRFPGGVTGPEDLWRLLDDGADAIAGFPTDRGWDLASLYHPDPDHPGTSYTREGGFLADVAGFDADFFGMSPREALATDPQQRLLLETAWETIERAGIAPRTLRGGRTGVFVGAGSSGYAADVSTIPDDLGGHLLTGTSGSVISGRLSYVLGLQGPSMTVDTACSSSLVALHLAATALQRGECSLALAGGVTVMANPGVFVEFARQRGLAADGRCKAFSDDADGTGWGEGVGLVLLERLSDACAHGHHVLGIVAGSAVNSDGASNGLTAPNGPSQRRVITDALEAAGLTPADVDAVEAHGTGTSLGDPIEAQALLATYGAAERSAPLWVRSVKSNLGHTQAAAGIAGVIAMLGALAHERLPRTLHADTPSSRVRWERGAVSLLQEPTPWPALDRPRRGAVSAFGVSGTNAHVVLEQAPADVSRGATLTLNDRIATSSVGDTPWILSARSRAGVDAAVERLTAWAASHDADPAAVASALAGRTWFDERAVLLGETRVDGSVCSGATVVVLPGQGAQRLGMGRELCEAFPVYREAFDAAVAAVDAELGSSLRDVVWGEDAETLARTEWAQPALFVIQVAGFRLLESWGLDAPVLVGHSVGEIAAAHLSGALSLEDAGKLVVARGRLMGALPEGGSMAAVSGAEVPELPGTVGVAAHNSPTSIVLSGETEALEQVLSGLPDTARVQRLHTSHAFHSPLMAPAAEDLAAVAATLTWRTPQLAVVSTVTGQSGPDWSDPQHWATQLTAPVLFAEAMETADPGRVVEIGPHPSLIAHLPDTPATCLGEKDTDPALAAARAAATLWATGAALDAWLPAPGATLDLPTYPFEHQRFWLEPAPAQGTTGPAAYAEAWTPVSPTGTPAGRWVVAGDDTALADALRTAGVEVATVADPDELDGDVAGVLAVAGTADPATTLTRLAATLRAAAARGARLWVVTRGAVRTGRTDPDPAPLAAGVWGLARTAALEAPAAWGGVVDLPAEGGEDRVAAVLADGTEDQVALRPTGALARRLQHVASDARPWTPRDTVLVTGGTGALGAHVARWAAEQGAARLVLAGRRGPDAPGAAELLAELRATGVDAEARAVDVTDRDAVAALVAAAGTDDAPLRAVVHAAGVLHDGVLDELDPEAVAATWAGKVDAGRHLDELTRAYDLDAFVVFSSFAGVVGNAGQAAYAAANAALDALADARRAAGLPAAAIAWGPWAGGGMAEDGERSARGGVRPLAPAAALDVLGRVGGGGEVPTLVADVDWATFVPAVTAVRPSPLLTDLPEVRALPAEGPASTDRPRDAAALHGFVHRTVAAVLGHASPASVDPARPLHDLGLDSLTAVDLRNRLDAALDLHLPATVAFDHPSVDDLAAALAEQLGLAAGAEATRTGPTADDPNDPVVVVGMACRFPGGVAGPEDLWALLESGGDGIGPFPADRGWDLAGLVHPDPDHHGTTTTALGGFLADATGFDAPLFGISPREALAMDPQQRLVLESAWEAFERAGLAPDGLRGSRTGVFLGTNGQDYAGLVASGGEDDTALEDLAGHLGTGTAGSVLSGRVAYTFGLQGPAVTVDTACSASLVALHWAATALHRGECDRALVGGATVMATPGAFVEFSHQRGLAADGRCKAFADGADGTGWGEGVGMLVLERLSAAHAAGHRVLAVIRGSAINSDGASNGLTAPNGPAQQRVIRDALAAGGLSTADVDAVEAHGTGTALGDPIEAQALLATYGSAEREAPLWIGSVKSNLGHTQAAAGVAGVIKAVLAVEHGVLPATLHAGTRTDRVAWDSGAVDVAASPVTLPALERPHRIGVSSFGISGTNAHVIIEGVSRGATQSLDDRIATSSVGDTPVLLSAQDDDALRALAARILPIADRPDVPAALAHTRAALPRRAVATDTDALAALAAGQEHPALVRGVAVAGPTAVVLPGQGAQRIGSGRALHDTWAVYATAFDAALDAVNAHLPGDLRDVLWAEDPELLARTEWAQPALFVIQVAGFRLLESWGLTAPVLIGHSVGEIAAAHLAGALSLEDAGKLVVARGRLMGALPQGGSMAAVSGEVEIPDTVAVAAYNSASSVVLSGETEALEQVLSTLEHVQRLHTSHAFHSPLMAPAADELRDVAAGLTWHTPQLTVVSTVTGEQVDAETWADPQHWAGQLTAPVRFADAVAASDAVRWVEIGARPTLTGHIATDEPDAVVTCLGDDATAAAAALWTSGAALPTWIPAPAGPVDLPTYPFTHRRYWPRALDAGTRDDGRLTVRWETLDAPATAVPTGRWVVLGDDPLAALVAQALAEVGAEVDLDAAGTEGADGVVVAPGELGTVVHALGDAPLWCVTRGAVATGHAADPTLDPRQAAVWGLGRVAALEHPGSWGGLVDLDGAEDTDLAALLHVLAGAAAPEDQLAIRDGETLARRVAPVTTASTTSWEPRGAVLITGGTGGLGAHVARWAAGHGAERIVLTSRRGSADELVRELGPIAEARAVDVADRDALAALLEEITPDVVVHAAGVGEACPIAELPGGRPDDDVLAKARGAEHLDELLRGDRTRLILFSSIAGVWGAAGQPSYAAANAHLDALAARRRAAGLPTTAIAWGPWAGEGLAAGDTERLSRQGLRPLDPDTALTALAELVDGDDPAPVVAPLDAGRFVETFTLSRPSPLLAGLAPEAGDTGATGATDNPLKDVPPARLGATVLDLVRTRTAEVLDLPEAPEPRATFKDLGVDSLTAVDLRGRLARDTGLTLSAALVFDHPTPTALAEHLTERLGTTTTETATRTRRTDDHAPVAIVGMACRYPGGVTDPESLWDLVQGRGEGIGDFPTDRGWDLDLLAGEHGSTTARGGFLPDAADFDAAFFGVAPREAAALDPQQRLVLETAWEAVERAGIDPTSLRDSRTGVYVGASASGYATGLTEVPDELAGQLLTGTAGSVVSGRIAYTLGLRGPSLTVDTACSSSLVALHLAVRALRAGDCDAALVGGVAVMASPAAFVEFSRQGGLAADGRCKSFGADADGTGWSEGVGVVMVERLDDALAAGHRVLAVVRGSAVNADGASNGLTAPHGPAQEDVLRDALADAGVEAAEVDAVEAHGTGTVLGDPIEAEALAAVYGAAPDRPAPLWLGSLKSNIGHTQAAAGVGGIVKMVQALRHGTLPPTLHAERPTPHVSWEDAGLALLTDAVAWEDGPRMRRAGVSAFGVSGTNAHVVLEAAPAVAPTERADTDRLLPWPFAGRTVGGRRDTAAALATGLEGAPADLGFSLATTRAAHEHRGVVVAADLATARAALAAAGEDAEHEALVTGSARTTRTAWLFSGQGSQRVAMGRDLAAASPVFAAAFDDVCTRLDAHLDRPLRDVIGSGEDLERTGWSQPALFAVEVALAALLRAHGVEPDVVVGHSVGQFAAAHVAGVLDLDDAARLVAARARAMDALPDGGGMVAVRASEEVAREILAAVGDDTLALAAVNGPAAVTLSGSEDAVARVKALADERGVRATALRVSHAFHSPLMAPAVDPVLAVAGEVTLREPTIPMVCDRRGRLAEPGELTDPAHWGAHLVEPVRFADAVAACVELGATRLVEVGPDATLSPLVAEIEAARRASRVATLRRDADEAETLLRALAALHVDGVDVDFRPAFAGLEPAVVDVPVTPLRRRRHWLAPTPTTGPADVTAAGLGRGDHPLLPAVTSPAAGGAILSGRLDATVHPWLAEHRLGDDLVLPTAAYLDLLVAAGDAVGAGRVGEVVVASPLVLGPADRTPAPVDIQVEVAAADDRDRHAVVLSSRGPDGSWRRHATARVEGEPGAPSAAVPTSGLTEVVGDVDAVYERWAAAGTGYGATFRAVRSVARAGDVVVADLALPTPDGEQPGDWGVHPALLDAALQAIAMADEAAGEPSRAIVFAAADVTLHAVGAVALRVALTATGSGDDRSVALEAVDPAGAPVLSIGALRMRPAPEADQPAAADPAPTTGRGGRRRAAATAEAPVPAPAPVEATPVAEKAVDPRWAGRDREEIVAELLGMVRARTASVLGLEDAADVTPSRAFTELGVSSLGAVEIRDGLEADTGTALPATAVFDHPSPEALAAAVHDLLVPSAGPTEITPVAATTDDPIVIVATACRLPGGVTTPEEFWALLAEGGDAIGPFPTDRGWDLDALYDPDPDHEGTCYAREGGFLADAGAFDAAFFGISPREALAMDPQQRLLLECSWEAIERAGVEPGTLRGSRTGVFAGITYQDYSGLLASSTDDVEGYIGTGTSPSVLSGRVAYLLGLEGPALSVDTACSSSLVALHLATRALRSGECDLALAGGVTVMASPGSLVEFSRQRALAPDGRCKPFAEGADGASWAEGAGTVLLERLSDARRQGHPVLAVVAGSALNSDGASNGLTAPNGPSQQRVLRAALADAGLQPGDVDAVEAHGTGTTLGDPIEAQALIAVYGADRDPERPLRLGSVKSNIGHGQAAAGVAGVIKIVEALRHGQLPRTLHLDAPTSHVDWSGGGVALLDTEVDWAPEEGRVRRAGISGFGMSGTNAHVVLAEPPAPSTSVAATLASDVRKSTRSPVVDGGVVWLWGARSAAALGKAAGRLAPLTEAREHVAGVADVLAGRTAMPHRAAVVVAPAASEDAEMGAFLTSDASVAPTLTRARLEALAEAGEAPVEGTVRGFAGEVAQRPVFVFPGQGAQWVGMGARLLDRSPVFTARLQECSDALVAEIGLDVVALLREHGELERVDVVQPTSWAVMVALAAVWEAAGVTPAAVVGHSQGEIAAAVVAGVLSVADGARVVAGRARLLAAIAGDGGMGSISLPVDEVRERVEAAGLSVAAVNGPRSTVVSGPADALDALLAAIADEGVRTKRVAVDYASHSAAMESLREDLLAALAPVTPGEGNGVRWYSTVRGADMTPTEADAEYWYTNLRTRVGFHPAIAALLGEGHRAFVEVGPHPVLLPAIAEAAEEAGLPESGAGSVATLPTLRRDTDRPEDLLLALARAWTAGVPVDPAALGARPDPALAPASVPTTAFARTPFWPTLAAPITGDGAEDAAWAAPLWEGVDAEDVAAIAAELDVAPDTPLTALVPALGAWRERRRRGSTVDGWRYRITWSPLADPPEATLDGTWVLVTSPGADDPAPLAALLSGAGAQVETVEVTTGDHEDVRARMAERLGAIDAPAGVLALTGTDVAADPDHPSTPAGLSATLAAVQALGDARIGAPLWIVTRGAVATGRSDRITSTAPALVQGFGRVAMLEHADRVAGLLDLGVDLTDRRAARRLVGVLAGAGDAAGEDQLALRSSGLLARRMVRAGHGPGASGVDEPFRPRGTALVTGGTGALGGHLARWLARSGAEHVVLTSRRGPETPGADDLRAEVEALGARCTVAACDAADRTAVAELLDALPDLRVVIHAAGALDDGVVESLDPGRMEPVLRAKTTAATVLDELTRGRDLDAFVLFSSTSGTISGPGLGNYAPGNASLDALAAIRRDAGERATAVAWGHWGGPGGMGEGAVGERLRRFGVLDMEPDDALAALQDALDHDETTVAVTALDWDRFGPAFTSARPSPLIADIPDARRVLEAAAAESGADGDPLLLAHLREVPREDWPHAISTVVRSYVAAVLGHGGPEAVAADAAFTDLGFDSLTSVELRNSLSTAVGLRLPATLVFDHPTPAALTEHLHGEVVGLVGETAADSPDTPAAVAAVDQDEPIAIVGMGCRFPGGVATPEDFWALLAEGGDAIGAFPDDRGWDLEALYDPDPDSRDTSYARTGGFLAGAGEFDASFFGISPREALAMDPQQRLLLETSWEALERAGIDPTSLRGSATGVWVGTNGQDYTGLLVASGEDVGGYLGTGNAASVVSGRVAYALGLEGPAVTVDTACSASLVALHQAAAALRTGECTVALAGGVTVMATPGLFQEFSRQRGLAPDGRCKAFADQADGAGFSEGVGMLVVERLSTARAAGHPVLAVMRGSAVNSDGASNGLTAPNGPSQQRVIRAALASAGLTTGDIDLVEAHGTGTTLGDPIEAQAVLATYGRDRDEGAPILLGSVKSNVGHTQAAAGVAGVMKAVLAMGHGQVPPTLHIDEPSTHVDWEAGTARLVTALEDWPDRDRPRRAGVSSFGISGTNAHVIIEGAPAADQGAERGAPSLDTAAGAGTPAPAPLLVSGRTAQGRADRAAGLAALLGRDDTLEPVELAAALRRGRSVLDHRAVVLASDHARAAELLTTLGEGGSDPDLVVGTAAPGRTAVLFSGQGSQRAGMGRDLHAAYDVFAAAFDAACAHLDPHLDRPLREVVFAEPGTEEAALLDRTGWAQPAIFAVEVAQYRLLESWGLRPEVLLGHSIGEITAAHVAGVLDLDGAARLVAARATLMDALPDGGAMAAVAAPEDTVTPLLEGREDLGIAAVNGPSSVVVSGSEAAVDEVVAAVKDAGHRATRLTVSHAFHSPLMEPMLDDFAAAIADIPFSAPRRTLVSALTGRVASAEELTDPATWVRHVRAEVRFADAVAVAAEQGATRFVEVGPDAALTPLVGACLDEEPPVVVATRRRDTDELVGIARAVAALHVAGDDVDPVAALGDVPVRPELLAALPTYPFDRRRHWPRPPRGGGDVRSLGLDAAGHPLLGAAVELPDGGRMITGRLALRAHPWIADHALLTGPEETVVLFPGTGFLELALAAAGPEGAVDELTIAAPLVLTRGGGVDLRIVLGPVAADGVRTLEIRGRADGEPDWTLHASGLVGSTAAPGTTDLTAWPPPGAQPADTDDFYARFAEQGFHYGPAFRGLQQVWTDDEGTVFAEVALREEESGPAGEMGVHPALLDAALHAMMFAGLGDTENGRLPFCWTGVRLHAAGARSLRVRLTATGPESVGLTVTDPAGAPVLTVDDLTLRGVGDVAAPVDPAVRTARAALLRVAWREHEAPAASDATPTVITATGDVAAVLDEVRTWLVADDGTGPALVVVTPNGPAAGLVRSAQVENPGRIVLVDGADVPADVLAALAADPSEPQWSWRDGALRVARLTPAAVEEPGGTLVPPPLPAAQEGAWRLDVGPDGPGTVDALVLAGVPAAAGEPGPGEVRIAVRAAGLNFRDVLGALGMYPGGIEALGSEAAGVVTAVGEGVELAVGDRVTGVVFGAIGPVARADARMLVRIPDGWDFAAAASVPIAFLTAWYALVDLGGVQAGEKVLVHAAAGGVGSAAVQIARHLGAEVFGTASDPKRDALRAAGLDDDHTASSRTPAFAGHFPTVDVVLDSLAGELVDASLGLLGDGGRFLEMGKTDVRSPDEMAAGVTYRAFDLWEAGPERIGAMLGELAALFASGALAAPPVATWDVRRARDAFRHVAQAKQVGKVVLTVPAPLDPAGTAIVTGGTGGLGAELARHLVAGHGVRSLVLSSRRGPDAPGAAELVEELGAAGARVAVVAADVTDAGDVDRLLAAVPGDAPLTAVVHTAGVLDDGILASQTPESLARVIAPKLDGARHLATATAGHDLAAFVLYSSVAGTLGSAGQANYAAANAALDALAVELHAAGRPARSLAWGPWVPTGGMTATLDDAERARISSGGMLPFGVAEGLATFDAALVLDEPALVPLRLDPETPAEAVAPMLREVVTARAPRRAAAEATPVAEGEPGEALVAQLAALEPGERPDALLDLVAGQVASVLGHGSPGDVDPDQPFSEIGFDSLTSVELRNRLGTASGVRLPATLVFDHPTPTDLAALLGERLAERVAAAGVPVSDPGPEDTGPPAEHDAPAAVVALESAVGGWDADDRTAAAVRLRALLTQLEGSANGTGGNGHSSNGNGRTNGHADHHTEPAPEGPGGSDLDDDLAAASSAEDVFALIDEELDA